MLIMARKRVADPISDEVGTECPRAQSETDRFVHAGGSMNMYE